MKKIIMFLCVLLMPIQTLAYSNYIYRGGNTLGIEIDCDGILVVGFYQINGEYNKGNPKLKVGDYITKINGTNVNSLDELTDEIEKNVANAKVEITFKRDKKEMKTTLDLIDDNGIYKTDNESFWWLASPDDSDPNKELGVMEEK